MQMREIMTLVEAKSSRLTKKDAHAVLPGIIEPTPENIARAKQFVLQKWIERFKERFPSLPNEAPTDLSSGCKFASLFVQRVFGGRLRGNHNHQFVELPTGDIVDLSDDAADVLRWKEEFERERKTGWKSDPQNPWAQSWQGDPHSHDPSFFGTKDHLSSMTSCLPRVEDWVREFLASNQNS